MRNRMFIALDERTLVHMRWVAANGNWLSKKLVEWFRSLRLKNAEWQISKWQEKGSKIKIYNENQMQRKNESEANHFSSPNV